MQFSTVHRPGDVLQCHTPAFARLSKGLLNPLPSLSFFFFFNDTAPPEIYTLPLHDALPICTSRPAASGHSGLLSHFCESAVAIVVIKMIAAISRDEHIFKAVVVVVADGHPHSVRSEEHTSELQSQSNLVCRLLLEKKKKTY